MNIQRIELLTADLEAQKGFYTNILELPTEPTDSRLLIKAGATEILFTQAPSNFDGAYHFAFNIPENQYFAAKQWASGRFALLRDKGGKEDFTSQNWNSDSFYFFDLAGNVLEFIARHSLQNATDGSFKSPQILNVSEIGLPSEDVILLANRLTRRLGVSVYKQEPNESFTPVGDEEGLLILPVKDRMWMPDSGVPARLLPIKVNGDVDGRKWEVRGVPYIIAG
jgi:catechol-2,3-dioxygenase